MPRPLRVQIAGGIYHVNTVGVRRSLLFLDDKCYAMFLAVLDVAVSRYNWRCASYCLLGTHYHLLVETVEPNIARGMQFLNGVYAQWFNRTYGERGHVFMSRYFDVLIDDEEQLFRTARYIALNPVEAGLCTDPASWPWSSYAALIGEAKPPRLLECDYLLGQISGDTAWAQAAFKRMVENEPWPDAIGDPVSIQGLTLNRERISGVSQV